MNHSQSAALFTANSRHIPGGVVSLNRKVSPEIAFVRGEGAYLWDADGNRYVDYHAAFGPYLLGHGDPEIEDAVIAAVHAGHTLTGSGTTPWEGEAAELLCSCVPTLDQVLLMNTGSEATYTAIRLARAATQRQHVVVMQGGYNGWHDYVACNVMTPLDQLIDGPAENEYPFVGMSRGMAETVPQYVHVVEFNSLAAVRAAFERYPVACLITEPILQNIGVVKPSPGYLAGLQALCHEFGVVFVLDEVKTGFRHALAGYHSLEGLRPDLVVFGKAIANGYPVGALGGKASLMALFTDPDLAKRVMIAGTYNGHPIPLAAAIATMRKLRRDAATLYPALESRSARLADGMQDRFDRYGQPCVMSRQASAMAPYFMDHAPTSWRDLALHHDFTIDLALRRALVERGIYILPLATKQISVSSAHTDADIDATLDALDEVLRIGLT